MRSHITPQKENTVWQLIKSKVPRKKSSSLRTDAELFHLMCSIFPDDVKIPIEELVMYGMGLGLFQDVRGMSSARVRVHEIINAKKYYRKAFSRKIRLRYEKDEPENQYVEMLDGARDLTKPIPSYRETVFEKLLESKLNKYFHGLSLVLKKVDEHLVQLECPKLTLLQLQYRVDSHSIPIDFFEGMKELLVLSFDIPSMPQSLTLPRNLRALCLKVLMYEDMSSIGCLQHLEFLSISTLSKTEVPRELGQLEKLRLLDLRKMNIAYISPGVLSRMMKLEELYLPFSFGRWGCKTERYDDDYDELGLGKKHIYVDEGRINDINDGERVNASFTEIASLQLNALQICIPEASILHKNSLVFQNIKEFKILKLNNATYHPFVKYSTNVLQLTGDAWDIKESDICRLLSRTVDLSLIRVRNLKDVISQLKDNGFPKLKMMIISECDELEYLVDMTSRRSLLEDDCLFEKLEHLHLSMLSNLKEIFHGRQINLRWFLNLSQISIRFCPKLKYVFPQSILRGLALKSIEILSCIEMEGIFYEGKHDNIPLALFSIEKLDLHSLPRLTSLLVHKDVVHDEVRNDINESKTTDKVLIINNEDGISHTKMHSAFPSRLAVKWLQNLNTLKIAFCDLVKVVFLFDATAKAFNSLEVLELHGLRNLVHIWSQIPSNITAFKNLQLIVLTECGNSYLFTYGVAKHLVQLQKIFISRCQNMVEVVKDDKNEREDRIVLPRLKLLELQHIPNLGILFSGSNEIVLPLLESLKLEQCNKVASFCNGLLKIPMLMGIQVNGSYRLLTKDHNAIFMEVPTLQIFTYADLKTATNNFSSESLIHTGIYRQIYKGWIDVKTFLPSKTGTGMPVTIERISVEPEPVEMKEWRNIHSRKWHPNLVKLLGHSRTGRYLVYEFISRVTLYDHLFKRIPGVKPLTWDMRINIAIGVAQGLNYLHTLEHQVFHGNIRCENILLSSNYDAKLFGFEYSRLLRFLAVEPRHASLKIDVFNYGAVLLELMTGVEENKIRRGHMHLFDWLELILSEERELKNIMDSSMEGQYSPKVMLLTAKLVLKCMEKDYRSRPTMEEVLKELRQIELGK